MNLSQVLAGQIELPGWLIYLEAEGHVQVFAFSLPGSVSCGPCKGQDIGLTVPLHFLGTYCVVPRT